MELGVELCDFWRCPGCGFLCEATSKSCIRCGYTNVQEEDIFAVSSSCLQPQMRRHAGTRHKMVRSQPKQAQRRPINVTLNGGTGAFQTPGFEERIPQSSDVNIAGFPSNHRPYVVISGSAKGPRGCWQEATNDSEGDSRTASMSSQPAASSSQPPQTFPKATYASHTSMDSCFLAPPHPDGALFGKQLSLDMELPAGHLFHEAIGPSSIASQQATRSVESNFSSQPVMRPRYKPPVPQAVMAETFSISSHSDAFSNGGCSEFLAPHPDGALFGKTLALDMELPRGSLFPDTGSRYSSSGASTPASQPPSQTFTEYIGRASYPLAPPRPPSRGSMESLGKSTHAGSSLAAKDRPPSRGSVSSSLPRPKSQGQSLISQNRNLQCSDNSEFLPKAMSLQSLQYSSANCGLKKPELAAPNTTKWLAALPVQTRRRCAAAGSQWTVSGGLLLASVAE